jgi:lysophospholipase L1-like esterase
MKTIGFLGDSITCGYGLSDLSKRYATIVSQMLGMTEENYGITGTLVAKAGLNHSDGKDFVSRVSLVDGADVAIIFGGTNDYFWSDRPISGGNGEEYFDVALDAICLHVKTAREGKLTLFVTPYPHNGVGNYLGGEKWNTSSRHGTDAVNFNGHTLADYARTIESICQKHGLPCLNLHENFDFDYKKHTVDGCHPNEAGHLLLAEAIATAIRRLLDPERK